MNRSGLSRERTSLAWSRTALSYATCAALLARLAATSTTAAAAVVGAVGVLVTLGLLAAGDLRYRSALDARPSSHTVRPVAGPVALALLAGGSALMGLCALALIWS